MNDGILHEKDDPKQWLPTSRLVSMLDIIGGGHFECDLCQRWQSVSALTPQMAQEALAKHGWTFPDGKDICPKCSASSRHGAGTQQGPITPSASAAL